MPEQRIMEYALSIVRDKALKKHAPHMAGRMGSQHGWHHATDTHRALSWQPKTPLPEGAYRLDQVGCPPDTGGPRYPQIGRVNTCILGDTRKPIPTPNFTGISIKSGVIGIPLDADKPLVILSPVGDGDAGYIYINAAYLPPEWLLEGVWTIAPDGRPESQPLTITGEYAGIRYSYCVMPMAIAKREAKS